MEEANEPVSVVVVSVLQLTAFNFAVPDDCNTRKMEVVNEPLSVAPDIPPVTDKAPNVPVPTTNNIRLTGSS